MVDDDDGLVVVVVDCTVVEVVEVEEAVLVDEVLVVRIDVVEEVGAGSPEVSTQYDFPTSTAQVAGREGFF